jgi:phosphoribosylformylglycinamidine (FGAM) synthase-like amidotransferase family enzyme
MMPHPERAIEPVNQDGWTRRRSLLRREGKDLPAEGEGMAIFRNGVEYIRDTIL